MGQSDSKKKIEEEFEIYKLEDNGNALLRSKLDDKDYLMRVVSCTNQVDLERFKTLLESRAQIKSHHLLSLVQIKQKQQDFICSIQYKMYLVLEYSFKNTAEEIKERTKSHEQLPFQQSDLWSIIYSCCTALQALYSTGGSHECLAAQQIFINKDGFIKLAEPLLFGLEKNHLEAMRTKENGSVSVHLSPEIMNCLEDQNFFYYEKEKSDIFILAMIVIDLALLKTNYLYDVAKRRPNLELIPVLLSKVGERYTSNLTSILSEMLRIDSKMRPSLMQIVERVQKFNNIGQDFTLETETNNKSNDASSEKDQDRFLFQKPAKYKELQIKEDCLLDQSSKPQVIQERVMVRVMEQPSFSINEQPPGINQLSFEGRVFNTTPQQSYSTSQGGVHSTFYQNNLSSIPTPQSNHPSQPSYPTQVSQPPSYQGHISQPSNLSYPSQPSQPSTLSYPSQPRQIIQLSQPSQPSQRNQPRYPDQPIEASQPSKPILPSQPVQQGQPVSFQVGPRKPFDLYERSKSIDSIKVLGSKQFSTVEPLKHPFSAVKVSPFTTMEAKPAGLEPLKKVEVAGKKVYEPIFTHEIPEVYNIMMKNIKPAQKAEVLTSEEKRIVLEKQHVSTPQFNGELSKINRFSSFKKFPYQTTSRVSEQNDSTFLQQLELKKDIYHAQSQTYQADPNKKHGQLDLLARQTQSPIAFPNNASFGPPQPPNQFSGSTPFPGSGQRMSFTGSAATSSPPKPALNAVSSVSYASTPMKQESGRQGENETRRSRFLKISKLPSSEERDPDLEFIKEEIPDRGRYEGYKLYDQRNGHGNLYFKDGGHYDGEWKSDKMHGFGKLYYENGTIAYEGLWQNDEFNGQGRVYNMEPINFCEEFNYKDFSELGNKWTYYDGEFKNDSKHGKGYIKLTNGQMFEGLFDHDMIQGNGIFYKRSGEIIIGFWIDNKLFLNQSYQNQIK